MTENLLNTLEDLRDSEFNDFKWYLQQPDFVEPYDTIKVSKLERAARRDTVDLMVNAYKPHGALMVTKKVFEKIYRNDLVQRLSDTSSGPEGQSQLCRPQSHESDFGYFSDSRPVKLETTGAIGEKSCGRNHRRTDYCVRG